MRFKKKGKVIQLPNMAINHATFVTTPFIPTAWVLSADLLEFIGRGEEMLRPHRLVAIATVVVWGWIVAWVLNVPQVLYLYRPGGKNKAQRRLFILSVIGLFISLSALVILGIVQLSMVTEDPAITYVVASLALVGLSPIIKGCATSWRYIYITDPRGVYIAYTGQVLQPGVLYRTGLTWKTPALEQYLETEENKIYQLRFKDGTFELRYDATVIFPETPMAPEECKLDPLTLYKFTSEFLLKNLQAQCAKFTGMQCMKMQPGLKPVEEYVHVPALEPKGYEVPIRMRWSGKFKLSDT